MPRHRSSTAKPFALQNLPVMRDLTVTAHDPNCLILLSYCSNSGLSCILQIWLCSQLVIHSAKRTVASGNLHKSRAQLSAHWALPRRLATFRCTRIPARALYSKAMHPRQPNSTDGCYYTRIPIRISHRKAMQPYEPPPDGCYFYSRHQRPVHAVLQL